MPRLLWLVGMLGGAAFILAPAHAAPVTFETIGSMVTYDILTTGAYAIRASGQWWRKLPFERY